MLQFIIIVVSLIRFLPRLLGCHLPCRPQLFTDSIIELTELLQTLLLLHLTEASQGKILPFHAQVDRLVELYLAYQEKVRGVKRGLAAAKQPEEADDGETGDTVASQFHNVTNH